MSVTFSLLKIRRNYRQFGLTSPSCVCSLLEKIVANNLSNRKPSPTHPEIGSAWQTSILVILLMLLQACTHFALEDCGGQVLGENEARIRSSHFRMVLDDVPAAANRFLPYAAMSTLAYAENKSCGKKSPKITVSEEEALEEILRDRDWHEISDIKDRPACEDDTDLFFRVWKKESDDLIQIVFAFRGTWGVKDWLYGNLYWLTKHLELETQYKVVHNNMGQLFSALEELINSNKPIQFYTTGHSLGGGLAQHALYSYPDKVLQAIAFDPSPATGFREQEDKNKISACKRCV